MAAYRHGIETVIIPAANARDLEEIDPLVRQKLKFVIAEDMDTVLETALNPAPEESASVNIPVEPKRSRVPAEICQ